jgi:tRNA(Ile)-lysidine synthase
MNWIRIDKGFLRRFSPNARYLVGVSGGRDSVALLHWLVDLGYKNLVVCHLNHQLRGRSSTADGRFVEKLATRHDLDFELGRADVRALAAKKKMSIEAAAREARYLYFARTAKRKRCRTIFLAHHADDLVETFLINLFRGAGAAGLGGMREVSQRRINDVDLTIVRPLLGIWRDEINQYVRQHRLPFREDASNKNLGPLRNRIRRRIVPYLEKAIGRNIRHSVWRAAMIAAEEENWIEGQLPNAADVDLAVGAAVAEEALAVAKLRDLPVALQRRAILKWLRSRDVAEIGFDVVEAIRSLLDRDASVSKINLPQGRHVRRRAGKIFIE